MVEIDMVRPGFPDDGLTLSKVSELIFCAYKGVRTVAAKSTTSARQNARATVVKNEWDVGKVFPVQAKTIEEC